MITKTEVQDYCKRSDRRAKKMEICTNIAERSKKLYKKVKDRKCFIWKMTAKICMTINEYCVKTGNKLAHEGIDECLVMMSRLSEHISNFEN